MKQYWKKSLEIHIFMILILVDSSVLSCREFGFDYDPSCYEIKGNQKSDDDIHTRIDDEDYQEASGDSSTENEIRTAKSIDALTVRKCCNEDEVLNDLRVCVKPGSEKVPMPKMQKHASKHIGVVAFIRQKFTKFVNKHTNFTDVVFESLNGKFCDYRDKRRKFTDWILSKDNPSTCSDLIVNETSKNTWQIKPITVKCINEANECSSEEGYICVPKCCPHNQVLDIVEHKSMNCVSFNKNVDFSRALKIPIHDPTIHDGTNFKKTVRVEKNSKIQFLPRKIIEIEQKCKNSLMWLDKKKLEIMEDGKLFTENDGLVQIYDQGFCLDNTIVSGRFNSISAIKCQHVNPTKTFSVHVKNNVTKEQAEPHQNYSSCSHSLNSTFRIAYSVLGGFSLGFLLLTMAVYAVLPSLQNLPGKIVLSNVVAVTATTIVLLINYGSMNFIYNPIPCKILGHLVCYFGVSMFCWMTIMCFDLCTVFLKSMVLPHQGKGHKRFFSYSIAGWMLPITLNVVIHLKGLMNHIDHSSHKNITLRGVFDIFPHLDRNHEVNTNIRHEHQCFLKENDRWYYFYIPILILLILNFIMFAAIIFFLLKTRIATKRAVGARVRSKGISSTGRSSEHKSSLRSQISSEKTTTNKKGFLRLSKSINPTTSSPLLNDAIKEQMVLYTKLFLIMGLSWIFEILEPIILRSTSDENCSALVLIRTIDGINMLRGFCMFMVFVCKPSILSQIEKKYPSMRSVIQCTSVVCCWWACKPSVLSRQSTFYKSQKTATTPLPHGGSKKFTFETRDIEANKAVQFSLLHKNDSQTKNEAYDLAQMESADDVFYTARDYTQVDNDENKRFSTLRRSLSYENAMLRPC